MEQPLAELDAQRIEIANRGQGKDGLEDIALHRQNRQGRRFRARGGPPRPEQPANAGQTQKNNKNGREANISKFHREIMP
jgi:hypothetical protein